MTSRPQDRVSGSPEVVDRAVIVTCAATWLAALGVSVAAGVALADMGGAHSGAPAEDPETPWLLYTVIGVSALVIVLSIPLLLRARRRSEEPPPPPRTGPKTVQARAMMVNPDPPDYPGPTPARHSSTVISAAALDRMWLRSGLGMLTAVGLAYVAVGVATYLMALGKTTASWFVYGVAGVITVAMIAIPVVYLRRLHSALAASSD
ncbi:DUF2561 family protein [Mycolicibacterium mengxianglii]|uniref:DUF2561 family protein n=1 Tax=Mycolicibacterium mengxianglii TaxID=2736649 RepID=UPI0018D09E91|nr:DUF2561 family protein [Mycolicibacterium mengxianglii]